MAKRYKLKAGVGNHWVKGSDGLRLVQPGDSVELTPEQVLAFGDKFEQVDRVGETVRVEETEGGGVIRGGGGMDVQEHQPTAMKKEDVQHPTETTTGTAQQRAAGGSNKKS
ncbi:MAG: hypothetical protein R3349_03905 [Geminicoccaceae bacterium]|nr:hypothetical protein [Geminicoccaceae bacterium]